MRLIKTVTAMDLAAIQCHAGWQEALDSTKVHRYRVSIREGRAIQPLSVSAAGCMMLDGFHRLAAYRAEGVTTAPAGVFEAESVRDARIFQLQTNVHRRKASAEEEAELVELLADEEAEKKQDELLKAEAPGIRGTNSAKSNPAKPQRGRPKTAHGKAVDRVAKERGVTPAAVRKRVKKAKDQENTDPVSAELLKPPPSLASRLTRASVDLKAAIEKLGGVFKEMEGLRPGFRANDGRWAVLGAVNQALRFARAGAVSVESAQAFMGRIDAAKHDKGGRKSPVDAYDVRQGKSQAEAGDPRILTDEGELAVLAQHDAKHRDQIAEIEAAGHPQADEHRALARAEFAGQELLAREEDPARIPQPTVPEAGTVCGACGEDQVCDGFCRACGTPVDVEKKPMGLTDPPKVGLRAPGRKIRTVLVDTQGGETEYNQALETADAAGVAGGPPEADGDTAAEVDGDAF